MNLRPGAVKRILSLPLPSSTRKAYKQFMEDILDFHQEVTKFFDAFVVAFSTFDGRQVARLYRAPYLAVQRDGSAVAFNTQAEVESYFQMMVEDYSGKGCHSGRFADLEITPLGSQAVVASVTWYIGGAKGETLATWRQSYNLVRLDGLLYVVASVDHAR
ncbi:hypothetical protein [Variovorax rhizosphaerae]|uniref:Nuclear transport factor 2 family protein n=1 Tax=Variovorax rhizosphaerae TaxID=1836200 RepID=A0ABU8WQ08_9BURK